MHMQSRFFLMIIAVVLAVSLVGCAGKSSGPQEIEAGQAIVDAATATLRPYLEGDQRIPVSLLIARAKGILIIPGMGDVSFFFSVGGGNAVMMARTARGWTGPAFLSKGTGGIGVQAGVTRTSGMILYMNEEDVRYVLDTGAVMQAKASLTFLDKDYEANRTPEFFETGDVVFIGDTSGLYAGVGISGGGLSDRMSLNAAYHGVTDGSPENILYTKASAAEGARHLRDLLTMADSVAAKADGQKTTKKDGIEIPSN